MVGKILDIIKKFKTPVKIPTYVYTGMEKCLDGKVALVTGGSSGIGLAISKKLLEAGCKIIIVGSNENKLRKAFDQFRDSTNIRTYCLDISNVASINAAIPEISELFSERKIDILVNSAGVNEDGDFLEISEKTFDKIIDINLKGTYFVSQAVAKHMINNNVAGHILNISSVSEVRPAILPYEISKWGIKGLTMGLADELLPYGIVVNAIGPGPVATPMMSFDDKIYDIAHLSNPSGRFTTPDEIANLALFMVSGFGNQIIGDTVYMSGGGGVISLHR